MNKELKSHLIPISRFYRGQANKIFEEVNDSGVKFVTKNKKIIGVLLKPEKYQFLRKILDEYDLILEADKRMNKPGKYLSAEQVLDKLGISDSELDSD